MTKEVFDYVEKLRPLALVRHTSALPKCNSVAPSVGKHDARNARPLRQGRGTRVELPVAANMRLHRFVLLLPSTSDLYTSGLCFRAAAGNECS